jgi:tetratricopeptide (TPR) repeat protein
MALLKHSLDIALEHDLSGAANRALYNLTGRLIIMDRYSDAMDSNRRGLELARRVGSQASEWYFLSDLYPHYVTGRWNEVIARAEGLPPVEQSDTLRVVWTRMICAPLLQIYTHRGAVGEARDIFLSLGELGKSHDVQERAGYLLASATLARAEERYPEALEAARQCLAERGVSIGHEYQKEALHEAFDAAYAVGDLGAAERLIDEIQALPPAENTPMLEAHLARARARLARFREQADEAYEQIARATELYRDIDAIFMRAVTLLDRARWHGTDGHESDATPLLEEAGNIFQRLEASPWVATAAHP